MQQHREIAADGMQLPNRQQHGEIAAADTTLNQRVLMDQISNSKSTVNGPLCSRCLNLGHTRSKCPGRVRCWKCLIFCHTRNFCLSRGQLSWKWQPKKREQNPGQQKYLTSVKPNLVWMPKPSCEKAAECPDFRTDLPNSSASLNPEQEWHMRFLRGDGPDIPLDQLFEDVEAAEDSTSSSSDATSKQELKQKAANKMCAEHLIYNTNALPTGFTLRGIFAIGESSSKQQKQSTPVLNLSRPIIIGSFSLNEIQPAAQNDAYIPTGLELVPWRPTAAVLAIQVFTTFAEQKSRCAQTLIFGRKGLPADVFARASSSTPPSKPIIIDREVLQSALLAVQDPALTGLEIVPWKPIPHVLALQFWPVIVESRRTAEAQSKSAPVVMLGDIPRAQQHNPEDSGPSVFEFQATQNQPSPVTQRKRRSDESSMALPITIGSLATPLVESSVRHSTRRSSIRDGFREVRVDKEPSKKRKGSIIMIDGNTGSSGPVPIDILQGWGIGCGIPPAELSLDTLMQAPTPNPSPNEDTPSLLSVHASHGSLSTLLHLSPNEYT